MKKVNILFVEPDSLPIEMEINNDYRTIKGLIGGLIECPPIFSDVEIIIDEEGKLKQLPLNRILTNQGRIVDMLVGPIIIASYDEEGEMTSLSPELMNKYKEIFSKTFIEIEALDLDLEGFDFIIDARM